jgi:FkbM family methyltransferase
MIKIKKAILEFLINLVGKERIIFYLNTNSIKEKKEFYGQEGEDVIINRIMSNTDGFFVDVGAYHPVHFSTTKYFYDKGWKGMNIEPNPKALPVFEKHRPKDINLNLGVSLQNASLTYYTFAEPAYNTFSENQALERERAGISVKEEIAVETKTLEKIFDDHLPENQTISFLTIDAMGFDLNVIKSNNWNKYRPEIVIIHNDGGALSRIDIESVQRSEIYSIMKASNYYFFAKTLYSAFYIEQSFYQKRFNN